MRARAEEIRKELVRQQIIVETNNLLSPHDNYTLDNVERNQLVDFNEFLANTLEEIEELYLLHLKRNNQQFIALSFQDSKSQLADKIKKPLLDANKLKLIPSPSEEEKKLADELKSIPGSHFSSEEEKKRITNLNLFGLVSDASSMEYKTFEITASELSTAPETKSGGAARNLADGLIETFIRTMIPVYSQIILQGDSLPDSDSLPNNSYFLIKVIDLNAPNNQISYKLIYKDENGGVKEILPIDKVNNLSQYLQVSNARAASQKPKINELLKKAKAESLTPAEKRILRDQDARIMLQPGIDITTCILAYHQLEHPAPEGEPLFKKLWQERSLIQQLRTNMESFKQNKKPADALGLLGSLVTLADLNKEEQLLTTPIGAWHQIKSILSSAFNEVFDRHDKNGKLRPWWHSVFFPKDYPSGIPWRDGLARVSAFLAFPISLFKIPLKFTLELLPKIIELGLCKSDFMPLRVIGNGFGILSSVIRYVISFNPIQSAREAAASDARPARWATQLGTRFFGPRFGHGFGKFISGACGFLAGATSLGGIGLFGYFAPIIIGNIAEGIGTGINAIAQSINSSSSIGIGWGTAVTDFFNTTTLISSNGVSLNSFAAGALLGNSVSTTVEIPRKAEREKQQAKELVDKLVELTKKQTPDLEAIHACLKQLKEMKFGTSADNAWKDEMIILASKNKSTFQRVVKNCFLAVNQNREPNEAAILRGPYSSICGFMYRILAEQVGYRPLDTNPKNMCKAPKELTDIHSILWKNMKAAAPDSTEKSFVANILRFLTPTPTNRESAKTPLQEDCEAYARGGALEKLTFGSHLKKIFDCVNRDLGLSPLSPQTPGASWPLASVGERPPEKRAGEEPETKTLTTEARNTSTVEAGVEKKGESPRPF